MSQGCQAMLKKHMIVDSALTIINYDTLDQTGKANIDDHEEFEYAQS